MLFKIHFSSAGICACCTSLARFSSEIPTISVPIVHIPFQAKHCSSVKPV